MVTDVEGLPIIGATVFNVHQAFWKRRPISRAIGDCPLFGIGPNYKLRLDMCDLDVSSAITKDLSSMHQHDLDPTRLSHLVVRRPVDQCAIPPNLNWTS